VTLGLGKWTCTNTTLYFTLNSTQNISSLQGDVTAVNLSEGTYVVNDKLIAFSIMTYLNETVTTIARMKEIFDANTADGAVTRVDISNLTFSERL
jgi:hypothetical protein